MESPERLVLHDQISDSNGLGNGVGGNPAVPFAFDLLPRQTLLKLFENNSHHDPHALERRLPATDG